MNLKTAARPVLQTAARVPPLRRALIAFYDGRDAGNGWSRAHPYDQREGIDASGSVPGFLLRPGDSIEHPSTNYGGCQPSVVRHALDALPDPAGRSFADFGCGKGRVLVVASERPFAAIVGVELSPTLAAAGAANAAIVAERRPERTRIEVVTGDATAVDWPAGPLVIFMYRPFGPDVMSRVVARIEAEPRREFHVIYVNPVHGDVLDRSAALRRRHAAMVPYAPEEMGFGPGTDDALVIWQSAGAGPPGADPGAERPIVIVEDDWRAELGPA